MIPRVMIAAVSAALLLAAPALAQPPPEPAADRYEEAMIDLDEGRYREACAKLESITVATPDRLIAHHKLGGCYLALGKLASAWSRFILVRDRATEQKSPDQAAIAAESARQIEARLARLAVVVPAEVARTPGLTVLVDGAPLAAASFGEARPVDTGAHRVEARSAGGAAWERTVVVDADGKAFSVTLPPLVAAAPSTREPPPAAGPVPRPWQRPLGLAVGGLGLAGLAVGVGLGALALQKKDESLSGCRPDDHCNEAGFRVRNEARGLGDGSTAALVAGGVLLSAGVVLFAVAPRAPSARPSGAGRPTSARIDVGLGHISVRGDW